VGLICLAQHLGYIRIHGTHFSQRFQNLIHGQTAGFSCGFSTSKRNPGDIAAGVILAGGEREFI
jgi:hypothetical protein